MPITNDQLLLLQKQLNITFRDPAIIIQAFVHRSFLNESNMFQLSNERLEFLGDSVLSYLVSDYLFTTYTHLPEGELTNLRSSMVKTSTLGQLSRQLHLGDYLYLSRGEEESGGRNNSSLLADTFEAVLGAIYVDSGLESAKKLITQHLLPLLPKIVDEKTYIDAKSSFQESVQEKIKESPTYKVLKEEGPDHSKEFTIGVYVEGKLWGTGKGKSKQEAEVQAAGVALEKWNKK